MLHKHVINNRGCINNALKLTVNKLFKTVLPKKITLIHRNANIQCNLHSGNLFRLNIAKRLADFLSDLKIVLKRRTISILFSYLNLNFISCL